MDFSYAVDTTSSFLRMTSPVVQGGTPRCLVFDYFALSVLEIYQHDLITAESHSIWKVNDEYYWDMLANLYKYFFFFGVKIPKLYKCMLQV